MEPKAPSSLFELQRWFGQIETYPLTASEPPDYPSEIRTQIRQKITDGPQLKAEERIRIYNEQYWWRLWDILQNHYPSLVRLFGQQDFNDTIASPYLIKYPPRSWDLHTLGSKLPQWIQEEYRQDDIHLVLPLAEIDAAYQRIAYAKPIKSSQKIRENTPLALQPTVALFALHADLFAFRKVFIDKEKTYWEANEFPEIKKERDPLYFVLYQQGIDLVYETISQSEHLLLKAFEKGASIAEAISQSSGDAGEEQIGHWFQTWASRKWLFAKTTLD